jgi:hypothetical protein
MSMADLFMDAWASLSEADEALASGSTDDLEEVGNQITVAQESVTAIAERLAPGEDGDLDCAIIIPNGDVFTVEQREELQARLERCLHRFRRKVALER